MAPGARASLRRAWPPELPRGWTDPSILPSADRSISRTSRKAFSPYYFGAAVMSPANCRMKSGGRHGGLPLIPALILRPGAAARAGWCQLRWPGRCRPVDCRGPYGGLSSARASSRRERTPSFM